MYTIDWVRHGESCSNLISGGKAIIDRPLPPSLFETNPINKIKSNIEPPLSNIGIQHAINVGNEFLKNNKNYDIYIASGLSRTIMTALYALSQTKIGNIKLYIVPFINEHESSLVNLYSVDKHI